VHLGKSFLFSSTYCDAFELNSIKVTTVQSRMVKQDVVPMDKLAVNRLFFQFED